MSGREDSVTERFRKVLRNACAETNRVDLNAPVNGSDRYLNADEFFGISESFFLVEFKSAKHSLKNESDKPSACALCGKLLNNSIMTALHDQAHFAAWGVKERESLLRCEIGIYRKLVCCQEVLPDCQAVKQLSSDGVHHEARDFLVQNIDNLGVKAKDFARYLTWLFKNSSSQANTGKTPLIAYGYTYTQGIKEQNFSSYKDLFEWSAKVRRRLNPRAASDLSRDI